MGRLARYKKVKAFDPYAKAAVTARSGSLSLINLDVRTRKKKTYKERKKKSNAKSSPGFFDIAPTHCNDFDLSDPRLSVKTPHTKKKDNDDSAVTHILSPERTANFKEDPTEFIPKSDKEEARVARMLKTDMRSFEKDPDLKTQISSSSSTRIEDTKTKLNRLHLESLNVMKKVRTSSSNRHEKRKEYLLDQKKLTRKQKQHKKPIQKDDDYMATNNTKQRQESSSSVGYDPDSADRPPVFNALPKGAAALKKKNMKRGNDPKEMELLREKVQSQYQVLKIKRRKKGEFHL